MMKISAVIITCNEERNIRRCLESILNVADEIVVLDSGSTDQTKSICETYGARFFRQEWKGYGAQKNDANHLATYDMILSLDADEALSEKLIQGIQVIKNRKDDCPMAYSMNRLSNYCGRWIRHCGWYPDAKIRLFDRRFAHWDDLKVHEEIKMDAPIQVQHIEADLLHYSYYTISEHIARANKYTDLAAEELFKKNKKYSAFIIFIKSVWRFKRDYFFKAGFLDGFYGLVICSINGFSTFLKYAKLRQLQKNRTK